MKATKPSASGRAQKNPSKRTMWVLEVTVDKEQGPQFRGILQELNIAFFPKQHCSVVFFILFSIIYGIRWHKLIKYSCRWAIKTKHDRRTILLHSRQSTRDLNLGAFCARTKHSFLSKTTLFCSIFYALFND